MFKQTNKCCTETDFNLFTQLYNNLFAFIIFYSYIVKLLCPSLLSAFDGGIGCVCIPSSCGPMLPVSRQQDAW